MLKLYFAPKSRALRAAWLLEEMGLEYKLQNFALGDPAMRAAEYRAIHPMGRVPALEDGDVTILLRRLELTAKKSIWLNLRIQWAKIIKQSLRQALPLRAKSVAVFQPLWR